MVVACPFPLRDADDWVIDETLPFKNLSLPSTGRILENGCLPFLAMLTAAFQSASNTKPSLQ